jgi:eukaryotic-like serine/threonine-protein kinase
VSKTKPRPLRPLDSTRRAPLANLPRRFGPRASPHAAPLTDYREFQDRELIPGTRYQVVRLIGSGGMGRVYEVEHVELGKRFVLKALQRELGRREDLVARLRNEWRALARLEHPNIVNVTDAGTSHNGVPFYVMERLEGETLSMLLHRQRRLLPQQALAIAAGILEGLHAAHQIGVVHRDVKPPNIFLTGPMSVKVLDFGIAKIKDAKDVITARGIAVGTPRYMSPEQAQGTAVDARSDIYATGLMLFEMVSGIGPFDDAQDHNELLLAQLGRPAPLLSSVTVVAPELDTLVAAMLAKDPRERPSDAMQVARTLRELSRRYASFPGTETPTFNAALRPAPHEPPTRVEGPRRASQPAPAAASDTTTQQPAFEIATTAAHALPNVTQRLPDAVPQPATLYGSDTLVDPVTSLPTAVPGSTPERTERLLLPQPVPGQRLVTDPGPTRTSVPLAETPNLTPPPVVPMQPPPASKRHVAPLLLAAALAALALGAGALALFSAREPARAPAVAAATAPAVPALPAAPAPMAPPVVEAEEPIAAPSQPAKIEPPAPALAAPKPAPVSSVIAKNTNKNPGVIASDPAASPAKAVPAASAPAPRAKPPAAMPGSGL